MRYSIAILGTWNFRWIKQPALLHLCSSSDRGLPIAPSRRCLRVSREAWGGWCGISFHSCMSREYYQTKITYWNVVRQAVLHLLFEVFDRLLFSKKMMIGFRGLVTPVIAFSTRQTWNNALEEVFPASTMAVFGWFLASMLRFLGRTWYIHLIFWSVSSRWPLAGSERSGVMGVMGI